MSGAFITGARTNNRVITKYTQLNIQTSAQNVPISLVWGQKRMGTNLIWYNDFKAVNAGSKKGGGGKGGLNNKGATIYDYYVAVILALCEGPITTINTIWVNNQPVTSGALAFLGFTLFTGTASQAVWSYLTSKHPTQALPYAYTAYIANSSYSLGHSPTLPNHMFEIVTPLSGTMPGTVDVNIADVMTDFLTNPQYSIGLTNAQLNTSDIAFLKTYTRACGLFFSPSIEQQEQVASILDRWASLSNSWIFWSGSSLRVVPLGDVAVTGNGVTYTPITAVRFEFTYDDYIDDKGGFPVTVDRADPADCPNFVRLEIHDRTANYDAATSYWKDDGLVNQFGEIDSPVQLAHEICDTGVGSIVAQLVGQRAAYIRNTYTFKLGWEFGSLLEPGDIVELTEPHINLTQFPVRLRTLDEDENGNWTIVAEELPARIGTAEGVKPAQPVTQNAPNFIVDPGPANPPAILEPNSSLTNGVAQVWIAASGGANWGGCLVYISFDSGITYNPIGSISSAAVQGLLTSNLPSHADPDTSDTLAIDTTESQIVLPTDATHADADAFRTLSIIVPAYTTTVPNNGELIAYGTVTAGSGTFASNLTYLRRGLYGSTIGAHSIGDFFTRLSLNSTVAPGNSVLIYNIPVQYIGATIMVKLVSFNRLGQSLEDISSVTAYTYTPSGAGFGGGTGGVPTAPSGLAATPGFSENILTWNKNPTTDNVDYYEVFSAPGLSQPFSSASLIGSTSDITFTNTGLAAGSQWTYFLKAHNAAGLSAASSGVNCTTSATPVNALRFYGGTVGKPPVGQVLYRNVMVGGEILPQSLPGSVGGCLVAPTGNVTFNIKHNGVSIGTMNIAASATVATFTFTSAVTFSTGDLLEFDAPNPADATLSDPYYTLIGTR